MAAIKTALVTGASSGIGVEIARGLVEADYETVLAVRNRERGDEVAADIARTTKKAAPKVIIVDFASLLSIRAFSAEVVGRYEQLDVLVNNAGIWSRDRKESKDGIELVWATNQLGYFLTTELLKPSLRSASRARIVNVASDLARGLDLSDVEFKDRPYEGIAAYAQTKQANRMWTRALARRLIRTRITVNSMHPGGVATDIFKKGGGLFARVAGAFASRFGRTPKQGADTAVWLATSPELAGKTAGYYADRVEKKCRFVDEPLEERLFALCESMTAR